MNLLLLITALLSANLGFADESESVTLKYPIHQETHAYFALGDPSGIAQRVYGIEALGQRYANTVCRSYGFKSASSYQSEAWGRISDVVRGKGVIYTEQGKVTHFYSHAEVQNRVVYSDRRPHVLKSVTCTKFKEKKPYVLRVNFPVHPASLPFHKSSNLNQICKIHGFDEAVPDGANYYKYKKGKDALRVNRRGEVVSRKICDGNSDCIIDNLYCVIYPN